MQLFQPDQVDAGGISQHHMDEDGSRQQEKQTRCGAADQQHEKIEPVSNGLTCRPAESHRVGGVDRGHGTAHGVRDIPAPLPTARRGKKARPPHSR